MHPSSGVQSQRIRYHPSSQHQQHPTDVCLQQDSRDRNRDKLMLIRDSLKPFEQHGAEASTSGSYLSSAGIMSHINPTHLSHEQRSMILSLERQGYDTDAALCALKQTGFCSVETARDYLIKLNENHSSQESPIPIADSTGLLHVHSNGVLTNGNLHLPVYGNHLDESGSSRSTSPQQPHSQSHAQSHALISPRRSRQITPVEKDFHRTHIHISSNPSFVPSTASTSRANSNVGDRPKPTIYVDKADRPIPSSKLHPAYRDYVMRRPDNGNIQSNIGSSQIMLGAPINSPPFLNNPIIRTTFNQPFNNTVNINVRPSVNISEGRVYRMDVSGRDGSGLSSVHGTSNMKTTGIQNIIVDPDQNRSYIGYEDELRPSTSYDQPNQTPLASTTRISTAYPQSYHISSQGTSSPVRVVPMQNVPRISPKPKNIVTPIRSTSPLPHSISKRVIEGKYEMTIKPCQPRMYCFFMEQHVERMIQQHRERDKRTFQLRREMEAANLAEKMKSNMLEFLQQKESKYMRLRRQKMDVSMFDMIRHIGVGAFGRVSLVRKKDTGQVYAMKSLLKNDVIIKQQAAHVKAERDILAEADSLWIVKLFFSFQDDRCLYFVMEYVPGGDMMQLLINKGIFEEKLARFYIAELTKAIEYVHSLGFIHRDIKPDNILIDQQGHVKLTDFGLCTGLRWTHDKRLYGPENDTTPGDHTHHRRDDSFSLPPDVAGLESRMKVLHVRHQRKRDQAHSVVGTGNYMAPEVLMRTGHTQLCDWWSVGVILYEMVFGRPPFMSMIDDPKETQQKIINWKYFLDVSPRAGGGHLSGECISIIQGLCQDKRDRLGSKNGAKQVMEHPWFRGIDFENLRNTKAEYIPRVEYPEDTQNFEPIQIEESPFETLGKRAPNNPAFYEFTFRHFFDTDGQGCPSLRPTQKRPALTPLIEAASRHEPNSSNESMAT